jgi:hypothetical protein
MFDLNTVPSTTPVFGPALIEYWEKIHKEGDNKPMAIEGAVFRHSWAGWCARKIEYSMREHQGEGFEAEAIAPADRWRMEMGTIVHDYWQRALQVVFPDSTIETKVGIPLDAHDKVSAGHADAIVTSPTYGRVMVELKSRNGFGYKMDIGNKGSEPAGPASSAIRQGALNARAAKCDYLVVLHLSLEAVAPGQLPAPHKGQKYSPLRMSAEWWYTKDEIDMLATHEMKRVDHIYAAVESGVRAPRSTPDIPLGGRIVDPMKSAWQVLNADGLVVQSGQLWNGRFCDYCKFRDVCIEEGP